MVAPVMVLGPEGGNSLRVPLRLTNVINETPENVIKNLRRTMATHYKPFNLLMFDSLKAMRNKKPPISIVGFGPSLKKTWKKLHGDILACNGAHNWLIEKGVIPKYALFFDAHEKIVQFINPHKDVTYLIASRCHESVFKKLEGYNVYVWQAMGDPGLPELLQEFNRMEPMLHGGSTTVFRAIVLAVEMGYRKINFFGTDSSYIGEHTHVEKSLANERRIGIWCNGRNFLSTSQMAGQAEDFKSIGVPFRNQGCDIEFYGDGLLPEIASLHGFVVHRGLCLRQAKKFIMDWFALVQPLTT